MTRRSARALIARLVRRRRTGTGPRAAAATAPTISQAGRLPDVTAMVGRGRGRTVVIVAGERQSRAVARWSQRLRHDRVHVVDADAETGVEDQLVRLGPIDVLVELAPTGRGGHEASLPERFARGFRSVRRHGVWILDTSGASIPLGPHGLDELTSLLSVSVDGKGGRSLRRDDRELARSAGSVVLDRGRVSVVKRRNHARKLRHAGLEEVLALREPRLRVTTLAELPSGSLTTQRPVLSHGTSVRSGTLPDRLDYPALPLRHYQGRIASAGTTLFWTGRSVLPDSFRYPQADYLKNPRLTRAGGDFVRIPRSCVPRRTLPGHYYNIDSHHSGHFGHLTSEVLSRLWGWEQAKREIPDLKALFHLARGSDRDPALERALFTAFGIAESDLVWVNEPVWLESLVSAAPMWHNKAPYSVHPQITETWSRLTEGLLGDAGDGPVHERLFVSRGEDVRNRVCGNGPEVERFFADRGFEVVYPERLTLPEQARLFHQARVVAGYGGSGMFNLMYTRHLRTVIMLAHDSYTARNEMLYAAVLGAEAHCFWSPSPTDNPQGKKPFKLGWEFDFALNGEELAAAVAAA